MSASRRIVLALAIVVAVPIFDQASVIVASFVYHAAMRDEKFPRKPIPQKPLEKPKKASDERVAH